MFTSSLYSQIASFSAAEIGCINETLELENTSISASEFEWDLCFGEFEASVTPIITNVATFSGVNFARGMDLVYDTLNSNYHLFFSDRTLNHLFRMDIGPSLRDPLTNITQLTISGDALVNPEDIKILKDPNGNWFGFVGSSSNGVGVSRLSFGNSITDNPSSTNIGTLGLGSVQIRGLDVIRIVNNFVFVGLEVVGERILTYDLGTSLSNSFGAPFVSNSLTGGTNATGIDFVRSNSDWIAYVAFIDGGGVYRLNFGSDLFSDPTIENQYNFDEFNRPHKIKLFRNHSEYKALVTNFNSGTVLLNLGNLNSSEIVTLNDYSLNQSFEIDGGFYEGDYHFYQVDNGVVEKIDFISTCSGVVNYSTDVDLQIQPTNDTNINIELIAKNGVFYNFAIDTISISSSTAPQISYTSDNICINSSLNFTSSNPGLTYSWDFDGDGIEDSNQENPEVKFDTLGGAGTYTVRVDVNDGTCNNFFEQEITIYDPPPMPAYSFTSPRTCINTDFTFTNNTVDDSYVGPLAYLWEFIDEPSGDVVATATTKDAVYAFQTSGEKTVRLTSSIPGCTEVTEQTLMITSGPTADFTANPVCQNESMQFTNASLDAVTYLWDFGDGFSSTAGDPSHVYTTAGSFFVTLTATDSEGCDDTEVIEVAVSDSPQVNFDFDVPCTSADGIQFTDVTTVDGSDLVSWTWFVDDIEVSSLQSPSIQFESTGIRNVRLNVVSSNGCESSYNEDIEVLTSPQPDFDVSLGCQGEISSFVDNTTTSGNPIVSWLWTVDGVNYGTQDITHTFSSAGFFDITLEVTGQNFCSEVITKTIEVIQLPSVNFNVNGDCDNELIQVEDMSTQSTDPIVSRRWMLDGESVGNGTQLFLNELEDATYELELELETASGCVVNSTQMLEINEAPSSSFNSSSTYGIPDDQFIFSNSSQGAASYEWLLNGIQVSTNDQSYTTILSEEGTHTISLVTQNSLGCTDTASQEILIAIPQVDLSIGNFELIQENNTGRIFLEVQNFSNLPIEVTEAEIVLENQFSVTEQITEFIGVGQSSLIGLNVGIPLTVSEPSYFCVNLSSQYVNYPDIDPINNEKCLTIQPNIRVEDPFPNPVEDQFRMKVIAPEAGVATLTLMNSAGKIQTSEIYNTIEGLNNFFVEMASLNSGIYYVSIDVLGVTFRRKVIKL
ncbi:PKD domain-containing protein [Ekhidna sp.]